MKKTLLLSVVASTMIMAGGDIAPVEPVVETPEVAVAASGWDFSGNAVAYYQTNEKAGASDLGSGSTTWNDLGVQLRAVNKDLFSGIGAGIELSGLYSGVDDFSDRRLQNGDGSGRRVGGAVTQAYLTYGIANTSLKVGRQHLPKGLSPFAFTEGWQPLKNSFDAVLLVNSDLPDTTLVGAWVNKSNPSIGDMGSFNKITQAGVTADDGIYMIAAQNKSIDGLTLTGNYYFAPDMTSVVPGGGDVHAVWGDAKFKISDYTIGLQGGSIMPDGTALSDTTAFGAKIAGNFGMFDASVAFSTVDDGTVDIHNWGTGVKTPLYTQALLNQNTIKRDSDTFKVAVGAKALGGKFTAYYINSDLGTTANASVFGTTGGAGTYDELALMYKTKITENTTLFAAYAYQNDDREVAPVDESNNFVRVWARYAF